MATDPTPGGGVPSALRRIGLWLKGWEEALDFDIAEYHERRIARLEREVAALRSERALSFDAASSRQSADKEVS
jgi:hypothetical protein